MHDTWESVMGETYVSGYVAFAIFVRIFYGQHVQEKNYRFYNMTLERGLVLEFCYVWFMLWVFTGSSPFFLSLVHFVMIFMWFFSYFIKYELWLWRMMDLL